MLDIYSSCDEGKHSDELIFCLLQICSNTLKGRLKENVNKIDLTTTIYKLTRAKNYNSFRSYVFNISQTEQYNVSSSC